MEELSFCHQKYVMLGVVYMFSTKEKPILMIRKQNLEAEHKYIKFCLKYLDYPFSIVTGELPIVGV